MDIRTDSIIPPHEVRETIKLASLVASMEQDGWTGRAIVVIADGDNWQAITGSHRIAAAIAAGVDSIPCVVAEIDPDAILDYTDPMSAILGRLDECDRVAGWLREMGNDEAADLMVVEHEGHVAQWID